MNIHVSFERKKELPTFSTKALKTWILQQNKSHQNDMPMGEKKPLTIGKHTNYSHKPNDV